MKSETKINQICQRVDQTLDFYAVSDRTRLMIVGRLRKDLHELVELVQSKEKA